MSKTLVVVESPAKAKTIEKFLGKKYKVEASVGHVRDLPKSKMGINIDEDFEPKYITIRGKGKVLKKLRREAKKADKVLLATDPDREGEAIAWHVAIALKLDLDKKNRVVFSEITKKTINKSINNPRKINYDLVDAQQARRILDRLVGYSISPILWKKIRRGLSAGRVQSVASRIICDREKKIKAFEPEEYWTIDAKVKGGEPKEKFEIDLKKKEKKNVKISTKKKAKEILDELKKDKLVVSKVKKSVRSRKPYKPFTTSTLQREAVNKLGFSTKKTMGVAQSIYEGVKLKDDGTVGLITYMRTDSTRISDEATDEVRDLIKDKYSEKYLKKTGKKKSKKKDNVQDAHEAIRPTSSLRTPYKVKDSLNKDQFKLYELIWKRFVAYNMKPAKFDALRVSIKNGDYLFKVSGKIMTFDGFMRVYTYVSSKDKRIPDLKKGDILDLIKYNKHRHETKPPARYTEASLVKKMESENIGRPSTYSPTISTILKRGYMEKEGRYFKPTELGLLINDIMVNHFPHIVDLNFTSEIENRFDKIENGDEPWKAIVKEFYNTFEKTLEDAEKNIKKVDMTEKTDEVCEKCGSPMVIKHGRYGKFMACSAYPDCKNTKPVLNKIGVKCPECEDGDIIKRKTKKRRYFYGCSNYPDCNFMSWKKPIDKKCPKCDSILTERYTKKKIKISCSNKECDYEEKKDR